MQRARWASIPRQLASEAYVWLISTLSWLGHGPSVPWFLVII